MSAPPAQPWTREDYARDAREYYASLTLEDFMEATPQATQREATLVSFNELKSRRGNIGYFNELLVQKRREGKIEHVVPDNMVVLGDPGEGRRGSYAVEYEACPLLWALEYVSRDDPEKDYAKNFEKYESVFQVPYYLIFDPEEQSLLLYHLHEGRYLPVEENSRGRLPIPEIEVEVGLLEGWVRFWFRGDLLPIPAELREQAHKLRQEHQALVAQVQELTAQVSHLETQLKERDDLLKARQRADALLGMLRALVEAKARQGGREDILTQLPAVSDPQQLQAWLLELG
jgi:Uma2 family endonuclease